ncbi:tetratricopeptide repeat protein [bacterium]|nr:tetratricopeptide repeat protein [bacterium]
MGAMGRVVAYVLVTVGCSVGVFAALWSFQKQITGEPPREVFVPEDHSGQFQYEDPDITRLREATRVRPGERTVWMSLARELIAKANSGVIAREAASLEALQALREVLQIAGEDAEALLMLGDLSFELQGFPEALEFYERYLTQAPEDDAVRARYASALTFLGRADESQVILQKLVDRNPEDFQLRAYLTLAFAQMGNFQEMERQGERALALAPSPEAREKLEGFLKGIRKRAQHGTASSPPSSGAVEPEKNGNETAQLLPELTKNAGVLLGEFLSKNPVAGPKIQDFAIEGDVFVVLVEDFPMQAMPPFAKEKFFSGIRQFVSEREITSFSSLQFRDVRSQRLEGELALSK